MIEAEVARRKVVQAAGRHSRRTSEVISCLRKQTPDRSNPVQEGKVKGYAMLRIGEVGWIEKEDPKCGPMDAICRPIALAPCSSHRWLSDGRAPCSSDIHTVYEGGVGNATT